MSAATAILLAAMSLANPAGTTRFGAPLSFGRYDAGFRVVRDGELRIGLWYPARSRSRQMTFGDYVDDKAAFEAFLAGAGVTPETTAKYLGAGMRAGRDATPVRGRFPLVVVAQGNRQSLADQAVLCEFLASRGFAVVTTPSPAIATPMTGEDDVGRLAQIQAGDLERAIIAASHLPFVDSRRIGAVGHSFGARSALLLAMHDRRVTALVSLDGGIGTTTGADSMRRAEWFRAGAVLPILHLYETEDSFMRPDLTFLRNLGSASLHTERIQGLHHAHFTTVGFAAAAFPELLRLTRGPDDTASKLARIAERTSWFLGLHVER